MECHSMILKSYSTLDSVVYIDAQGTKQRATVSVVHTDDITPYYTVRLADGRERQTIQERLLPLSVISSPVSPNIIHSSFMEHKCVVQCAENTIVREIQKELQSSNVILSKCNYMRNKVSSLQVMKTVLSHIKNADKALQDVRKIMDNLNRE